MSKLWRKILQFRLTHGLKPGAWRKSKEGPRGTMGTFSLSEGHQKRNPEVPV